MYYCALEHKFCTWRTYCANPPDKKWQYECRSPNGNEDCLHERKQAEAFNKALKKEAND